MSMTMSQYDRTGRSYMEQFIRTRASLFMKHIMVHLMEQLTYVEAFEDKCGLQSTKLGQYMTYYNE